MSHDPWGYNKRNYYNKPFKGPRVLGNDRRWQNSQSHARSEDVASSEWAQDGSTVLSRSTERSSGAGVDGWTQRRNSDDHRRLLRMGSARDAPAPPGSLPNARPGKRHFTTGEGDTVLDHEQRATGQMVQTRTFPNRRAFSTTPRGGVHGYGSGWHVMESGNDDADDRDRDDDDSSGESLGTNDTDVDDDSLAPECGQPCSIFDDAKPCEACAILIEQCKTAFTPDWPIEGVVMDESTSQCKFAVTFSFDGPYYAESDTGEPVTGRKFRIFPTKPTEPTQHGGAGTPANTPAIDGTASAATTSTGVDVAGPNGATLYASMLQRLDEEAGM